MLQQSNCRYGPGKAYLYSHGLYAGDQVEIHGRTQSGNWLWVKPANLERRCWAAASVLTVSTDVMALPVAQTGLPEANDLYGPPQNVQAVRNGSRVTVTWSHVNMTEDDNRGYLIEASLCQNGERVSVSVQTMDNSYVFNDEKGCSGDSSARLYTVEKHGYTSPVYVPWP